MLKSFELRDREKPLTVHGPPGTSALLERMRPVYGRPRYGLTIRDLEPDEAIRRDDLQIVPFAVRHRGTAFGYALVEDARPGRFDAELAARLGVTPGPDFGRLQRGETIAGVTPEQVMGSRAPAAASSSAATPRRPMPSSSPRTAPTCSSTRRRSRTRRSIAPPPRCTAPPARRRRSPPTPRSACSRSRTSPSRYSGGEIRDEARAVFADTEVPRDFDTIEIPLPERGEPELVRWDGGAHGAPRQTRAALEPSS